MMETPICDFVRAYRDADPMRLHMPGHKGAVVLGAEPMDITEVTGADSLYEAQGIILQSEQNAARLFGSARTCYSAEGSSLCIRAMLYLVAHAAIEQNKTPRILACRNVHKTFVTAAGLLGIELKWLFPSCGDSYLSCVPPLDRLERALERDDVTALYVTSPDYLGNLADIAAIAEICHRRGVLLLVDNAHGAYLKFLPQSRHPMDLGADLCCDSAHKTLPVLTGGAYLHISKLAPPLFSKMAKEAMATFGSTSPSYLILASLDAANRTLAQGFRESLAPFVRTVAEMKLTLSRHGYESVGDEPLKLTLVTRNYGYTGYDFAQLLRSRGIEVEFCDPDFVVMMLTPTLGEAALTRLTDVLPEIPRRTPILTKMPTPRLQKTVCTVRQAMLMPRERIPTRDAEGRILASLCVACPPAVPIAVCGERLDRHAVEMFQYYGITHCDVLKD